MAATVRQPHTHNEWEVIADNFDALSGLPGVVGAIDGTMIEIKHLEQWEGRYCRKGFPAFHMQAVVVDHQRFMLPKDEAKFNKVHSSTRIVVEMAFGRFKNVFRIFKSALLHKSATGRCKGMLLGLSVVVMTQPRLAAKVLDHQIPMWWVAQAAVFIFHLISCLCQVGLVRIVVTCHVAVFRLELISVITALVRRVEFACELLPPH
ncbi:TPA: hypothetical protein N0F65_011793 [Lagenidium giganteum]|uniref:DDE Tnp4 domain-containing protein n=1 Tax=Lagenidium giganteum TaxID=4803 RepID=A0AAV2YVG7_9STRA|nr:TPA: hypothetical protein N0F65_011793 [Lagenidium giganteum]